MEYKVFEEKEIIRANGLSMLVTIIIGFLVCTAAFVWGIVLLEAESFLPGGLIFGGSMVGYTLFSVLCAGLKIVRPNEARIFTLFGVYYGTIKTSGYFFVNPFCVSFSPVYEAAVAEAKQKAKTTLSQEKLLLSSNNVSKAVSLKKQTLDNNRQKVNDLLGNPIIVGVIVIWHVENPTQAVFSVEDYQEYLSVQTDSIIRNVARLYPYDVFCENENDDGIREKTLRGSSLEIAETMQTELQKRVESAGLAIEEVKITHLAYAEEIAAAMLQRQQATAIIAARQKIVDGAVGMVKMAIEKLGDDNIVLLDEERKAVMVSNLLVVLCGNRDAQPIINSGTIY